MLRETTARNDDEIQKLSYQWLRAFFMVSLSTHTSSNINAIHKHNMIYHELPKPDELLISTGTADNGGYKVLPAS